MMFSDLKIPVEEVEHLLLHQIHLSEGETESFVALDR